MKLLIKNILLDDKDTDILIVNNTISKISNNIIAPNAEIIDGKDKAVIPSFFNGHNHAAMTLFRGYADDMHLFPWLEQKIWPNEAKLTENDVYWGTKLAALEMIKSGTTSFVDMYFFYNGVAKAIDEMGIRGIITPAIFDFFDEAKAKLVQKRVEKLFSQQAKYSERVTFSLGPHAIYTVSKNHLIWLRDFAKANDLVFNIHLSETSKEVADCKKEYGVSPVKYLYDMGVLNEKSILAHCLYISDEDIKIIAETGAKVVHNPVSNMKLATGRNFRYTDLKNAGVKIALGTDGPASSNNLDMTEAAKIASINQKEEFGDPTLLPAGEAFSLITETAEDFTGLKLGKIKEGYLADIALVNLRRPDMMPNHNYKSNLIYSGNGDSIDTLICDGKILMKNRKVEGEEEIYDNIPKIVKNWLGRNEVQNSEL